MDRAEELRVIREEVAVSNRSTSVGDSLELAEEEDPHVLQQSSASNLRIFSSRDLRDPMPPLYIIRETSRAQAPRATAWAGQEPQSRWRKAWSEDENDKSQTKRGTGQGKQRGSHDCKGRY